PASVLCHQSIGLVARALELEGVPTMTLAVVKDIIESVRPPRVALYDGEPGSVSGKPNFPEHQRRILDESLRLIEPMDQPGTRKLVVELESQVELSRGERSSGPTNFSLSCSIPSASLSSTDKVRRTS